MPVYDKASSKANYISKLRNECCIFFSKCQISELA